MTAENSDSLLDRVVMTLIDALGAPEKDVALRAADALDNACLLESSGLMALASALRAGESNLRLVAAVGLELLGPRAQKATSALTDALKSPVAGVRWAAASALGAIGSKADCSMKALKEALRDANKDVRYAAATAVIAIDSNDIAALEKFFLEALVDPDEQWRNFAEQTLIGLGVRGYQIVSDLTFRQWRHLNNDVKAKIGEVRRAIRLHINTSDVIEAVHHPDAEIRLNAIALLGFRWQHFVGPTPEILSTLASALADPDDEVRLRAARYLQHAGPEGRIAIPALEKLIETNDPLVRRAAEVALREINRRENDSK